MEQYIIGSVALPYFYNQFLFLFGNDLESIWCNFFRNIFQAYRKKIFLELLLYIFYCTVENFFALVHQYNVVAYFFNLFHAVRAEYYTAAFFGKLVNFFFN